jgi:hypothetical protein
VGIWMDYHAELSGTVEKTMWSLSHILMIGGMLWAIFGALVLPSVFDSAKPVITYFFPNGIPIVGGRRGYDPSKQPQDSPTQGGDNARPGE